MASYFDSDETADLALLRSDVQDHADLERIASEAEADCIEQYTERYDDRSNLGVSSHRSRRNYRFGDFRQPSYLATEIDSDKQIYVLLDGYAEDAADADGYDADRSAWTGFAKAMRRAIAHVVNHRLLYYDDDPTVTSERRGRREVQREANALDTNWPDGWDKPLNRYDLREGLYHI